MFQVPPAMVKAGLVQLPVWVVCGTRTVAGPTAVAVVVAVVPPATVVEVAPAAVVLVDPAAVVEVELAPAAAADLGAVVAVAPSGGNLYPADPEPEAAALPEEEPAKLLNHIPRPAANTTASSSCQVFQDRRSLILSSPCSGW
jgi:hypothetical protein